MATVVLGAGLFVLSSDLMGQPLDREGAEQILEEAIRYAVESSGSDAPILVAVGMASQVAAAMTSDTTGFGESISHELDIPIHPYDENTFCDMDRREPRLRSREYDLRVSAHLLGASSGSAQVRLWITAGTLLAGTTGRLLDLVRDRDGWHATNFADDVIHASSTLCVPEPVSLPSDEIAAALSTVLLANLEAHGDTVSPESTYVCIWQPRSWEQWDRQIEESVTFQLERRGLRLGDQCIQIENDAVVFEGPDGEPSVTFEVRPMQIDEDDRVIVQVGVLPGNRAGGCGAGRSPLLQCVLEYALERTEGEFSVVSQRTVPSTR